MKIGTFIDHHYRHFNASALKRATDDYINHIEKGGKIFLAMAGAMSSAELGISLAPMIKHGKIHAISCTGANLEESIFRLIANSAYKSYPDYRYLSKEDDERIFLEGERRVTCLTIPEEEAFRKMENFLIPLWREASREGKSYFPHEYLYMVLLDPDFAEEYDGDPDECWLLEAAKKNLPIFVPGWEDSTLGNIFASYCVDNAKTLEDFQQIILSKDEEVDSAWMRKVFEAKKKLCGEIHSGIMKTGINYMERLYQAYLELSQDEAGLGFFQIGGGIAGDFPICVVPSLIFDRKEAAKPWSYFCQISDSITSYGSYSGAPPNEKITWGKLTKDTPMHVIESDATIVAPLIFSAVLEVDEENNAVM